MFHASDHLNDLIEIATRAADAIMFHHARGHNITEKSDGSPVTLADQASEDIVLAGLKSIAPDIPIVAEEQAEAGFSPDIQGHSMYWLVDPLDGTKEFIKGTNDFTINIGLIENGTPVFGLVYLPATRDIYYGGEGIGAFLNHRPMVPSPYHRDEGLIIIGSGTHPDPDKGKRREAILKGHPIQKFTTRGSGLKFCLIADGTAHLYPRFVPTCEWDTCAAHAMLLQTGGDIIDYKSGQRLSYGKTFAAYRNGPLITGTKEVLDIILPLPQL